MSEMLGLKISDSISIQGRGTPFFSVGMPYLPTKLDPN
jgi:hypothetical protein